MVAKHAPVQVDDVNLLGKSRHAALLRRYAQERGPKARPFLARALSDGSVVIRQAAVAALALIDPHDAEQLVLAVADGKKHPSTRRSVLTLLPSIPTPTAFREYLARGGRPVPRRNLMTDSALRILLDQAEPIALDSWDFFERLMICDDGDLRKRGRALLRSQILSGFYQDDELDGKIQTWLHLLSPTDREPEMTSFILSGGPAFPQTVRIPDTALHAMLDGGSTEPGWALLDRWAVWERIQDSSDRSLIERTRTLLRRRLQHRQLPSDQCTTYAQAWFALLEAPIEHEIVAYFRDGAPALPLHVRLPDTTLRLMLDEAHASGRWMVLDTWKIFERIEANEDHQLREHASKILRSLLEASEIPIERRAHWASLFVKMATAPERAALEVLSLPWSVEVQIEFAAYATSTVRFDHLAPLWANEALRFRIMNALQPDDDLRWIGLLLPMLEQDPAGTTPVITRVLGQRMAKPLAAFLRREVFDLPLRYLLHGLSKTGSPHILSTLLYWLADPRAAHALPMLLHAVGEIGDASAIEVLEALAGRGGPGAVFIPVALARVRQRVLASTDRTTT